MRRSKILKYIKRDQVEPDWQIEMEGGHQPQRLQDVFPEEISSMLRRREEKVRKHEESHRRKHDKRRRKEETRIALQREREWSKTQREREIQYRQAYQVYESRAQQAYLEKQREMPAVFECFMLSMLCGFGVFSFMGMLLAIHELCRRKGKIVPLIFGLVLGLVGFLFSVSFWLAEDKLMKLPLPLGLGAVTIASFVFYRRSRASKFARFLSILLLLASALATLVAVFVIGSEAVLILEQDLFGNTPRSREFFTRLLGSSPDLAGRSAARESAGN